jgi:hypothetical protein
LKKGIILLGCLCFLLTGCLKLKTQEAQEAQYESLTNEMETIGIGLNESKTLIIQKLGKPDAISNNVYKYDNEKLTIIFNTSRNVTSIASESKDFGIENKVKVNDSKRTLINNLKEYNLYQYSSSESEDPVIYLTNKTQKIYFYLNKNKITKIETTSSEVPLAETLNIKDRDDISDEEVIEDSSYFGIDYGFELNSEKILSSKFLDYAKNGLFVNIPVPLGMDVSQVIRLHGNPSIIEDENELQWYFYKKHKVFFGFDSTNKVKKIKIPFDLSKSELMKVFKAKQIGEKLILDLPKGFPINIYAVYDGKSKYYNHLILESK